jgi:serine/threonine-protein kinase
MDSLLYEQIQTLFHHAVERPEHERRAFLENACANDAALMAEVLAMLDADSRNWSLLDGGLPDVAYQMIGAPLDPVSSREFGPYRLTEILGEGGMGVVWLAERKDAGNLVAIKFLPHAGLSPTRRDRFTREIRTLGKLKHPFIARLYDAGTLSNGTPWFVMEYVEGARFTDYCRAEASPIRDKLRLFRKVCEAVQYAHGQEIIHRDLKPSNILVEPDGTPRLLDFGIARELHNPAEPDEQTRPGLRFLSPDYAAPEWALEGRVGFYTDVYSLGVILYEMLTGRLPHDRTNDDRSNHDRSKPTDESDPPRPSIAAPAPGHTGEPPGKAEWSDLDVLCLKAMRHDPGQRYQSVEALIRDIDHYLNAEPLEARPDAFSYRLGKFVRRNRRSVLAASLAFTLMVGLVLFFTARLARARDAAVAEAARTRRIQRFMLDLFGGGDKHAAPSNELRVVTLLDRGVQEASVLNSDPETQAELYQSLGRMYDMLGKHQKADGLLHLALEKTKVALGPDHPKVIDALVQLGISANGQAQFKDAERWIREGLNLAAGRLPPGDPTVLRAKSTLGMVLTDGGSFEKAVAILEPLAKLPVSEDGTYKLTALAVSKGRTGHPEIAESLDRQALAWDRKHLGNGHPRVAFDLSELATLAANAGRFQEAQTWYREAMEINQAWYGPDHPDTILCTNLLAMILVQEGNYGAAAPLLKRVLAGQEQTYGPLHPYVALALSTIGTLELKQGNLAPAEANFRRAVAILQAKFGDTHHQTATAKANLAQVFIARKQDAQAEPLLREALKAQSEPPQPGNMSVGALHALLGCVLVRQKRYQEAESNLTAAYAILINQPKTYAKRLQEARQGLVEVYHALHQDDRANEFRAQLAASVVARK